MPGRLRPCTANGHYKKHPSDVLFRPPIALFKACELDGRLFYHASKKIQMSNLADYQATYVLYQTNGAPLTSLVEIKHIAPCQIGRCPPRRIPDPILSVASGRIRPSDVTRHARVWFSHPSIGATAVLRAAGRIKDGTIRLLRQRFCAYRQGRLVCTTGFAHGLRKMDRNQ